MDTCLPKPTDFRTAYTEVADALDGLGATLEAAGPLDQKTQRLVKLALAVGAMAEGAVKSKRPQSHRGGSQLLRHTSSGGAGDHDR